MGHFTINIPIGYYLKFFYIGCQTIILGPFYKNTDVGDVIMIEEIIPDSSCIYNVESSFYKANDTIRSY